MRFLCAIAIIGVLAAGASNALAEPEIADGIKVVVHTSIITYQQVDDYITPLVDDARNQFRNNPVGFEKKINELREDNTERLVQNDLILHEFETAGYNLPDSVIDDYVQQRIRSRYGNRATLTKTLQAEGITFEKFREQIRKQFIVEQMRLKSISDAIIISPHKIEVYYVAHTNDFVIEEQVKLRMIVLNKTDDDAGAAHKLAEEILAQINGGAAFAQMASVYSQDSKRTESGDWGWVDKTFLRQDLATVAFALKPGEKSDIIDTPGACYLLLVEDKRPSHVKPLNEVRDDIEKTLLGEDQQRVQKQWIDRLKKKTFVRYF
jgi:peptidyl-prolyl cis-trans isomerase SurA